MKCLRCQHENPTGQKFCGECGARLPAACPSCGATSLPGQKFCGQCGAALTDAAATKFASPESYTPKYLAERILTSKSALEGERKQVTVLFADMKGSLELMVDRDPEEVRNLLDPVLERMMEAVHRYEGTVNQVMGDGIMALFGAPLACEDHAIRACYAALRMQETVKRYGEGIRRTEGIPLQIRVGLNSGEVVVRSIGSDLRVDYTAIGQTTHVAARMEQMALPGSILLPADTLALAEGHVEVRSLGPLPVKGLAAPVEVCELTGAATVRSRFQVAAARGLTRFVGRKSELDQLHQALERARTGHGQVVAVVGEPGVGKSRLYWEFTHSHRVQDWLVLESNSVSYGKATNYLPVIALLRVYFAIESGDDHRKIREKVTGKLLSLARQLEPLVSPMLWLLDVPVEDEQWARLDPPQRRYHILDGIKRLLLRESQVQPLMVLFEDLHWIDAETQALLDSLVESLPTASVLLLVNYRPEYRHGWASKTYYRQIQIDPLPPETAEALLDALLGSDAGLAPLKRLVIERTEGNPFFIEETIRSLVETGVLAGERRAYRLTRVLEGLRVPATARAILAARIDRLDPEDKRLLQAAAVIGTDVPFVLLQAVADEPEDRLRQGLAQLQATEFLYETRLFPDLEYTFRHALTHEVTYGSLLTERQRALHARIVGAIEALYGDRLDEHIERLGHHTFQGEVWDKAVAYARQAGIKAQARSAHREAVSWFEQALGALRRLSETRATMEEGIDLHLSVRGSLYPLGEFEAIMEHLRAAEAAAAQLNDSLRLGWVSLYIGDYLRQRGKPVEACTYTERAHAIAEQLGNLPLKLVACQYLGLNRHALGDYGRAAEFLRAVVDTPLNEGVTGAWLAARGLVADSRVFLAVTLAWLARSLAEGGRFDEAIVFGGQGLELARTLETPYSIAATSLGLGFVYWMRGEFAQGIQLLEQSRSTAQNWNITLYESQALRVLGYAYVRGGRVDEGLDLLRRSAAIVESRSLVVQQARVMALLGEAWLHAGRLDEATAAASRAILLARTCRQRGDEATAHAVLAQIALAGDSPDLVAAEQHHREALRLGEELGMRPLVAHCHYGLGELYRRSDNREQARQHLTTATAMYHEMEMRFYGDQAETEVKRLA